MAYHLKVDTKPIVIIELPMFINLAQTIWTDDERTELIDYVAQNPESGNIIPSTGGVRKLRWSRTSTGKRSGARVIYFYYHVNAPIYMLLAYTKATNTDLTPQQKRQVTKLTAQLKELHSIKGD